MAESKPTKSGETTTTSPLEKQVEQGYFGTVVDPTPNENYTVKGVTSGAPTPETDEKTRQKARDALGLR